MTRDRRSPGARRLMCVLALGACLLRPAPSNAQGLTGSLVGTVRDAHGGVISGAVVVLSSPALIGGPQTTRTNEQGFYRFPVLPVGTYALEISTPGFTTRLQADIPVGAGATIEHSIVLEGSSLRDLANRVVDSLIGRNVRIYRVPLKPRAYRFMLGDNSEVGIRW